MRSLRSALSSSTFTTTCTLVCASTQSSVCKDSPLKCAGALQYRSQRVPILKMACIAPAAPTAFMDNQIMDGPDCCVPPCSNLFADAAHCKSAELPSNPGLTGRVGEFLSYATLTGLYKWSSGHGIVSSPQRVFRALKGMQTHVQATRVHLPAKHVERCMISSPKRSSLSTAGRPSPRIARCRAC